MQPLLRGGGGGGAGVILEGGGIRSLDYKINENKSKTVKSFMLLMKMREERVTWEEARVEGRRWKTGGGGKRG